MEQATVYDIDFWTNLDQMKFDYHTPLKKFLTKKNSSFFFGEWEQINTNTYSHKLANGNSYQVRFKRFTEYKNAKGSRLRDTKKTKHMCYVEILFYIGDKPDFPTVSVLSKSVSGEGSEKNASNQTSGRENL